MKGLEGWFEIFRTGTHIDSAGNERTFDRAFLDNMVAGYNPSKHEAPMVIGHPKTDDPAWGWIAEIKRVGDKLMARGGQVIAEFQEMVKKGMFKKRSIALYPDGTLRHVGFLGALPPAVKGMPDIAFGEGEYQEFGFDWFQRRTIGDMFRALREFIIDKFDKETADQVIPAWQIEGVAAEPLSTEDLEPKPEPLFNEPENSEDDMAEVQELQNQVAGLTEEKTALDVENARLKAELDQRKKAQRQAAFREFLNGELKEGTLTPAQEKSAAGLMEVLSGAENFQFSEDGDAEAPLEVFKGFLKELPVQVEFNEIAKKPDADNEQPAAEYSSPVDEGRLALRNKADALAKKEGIEFTEALRRVRSQSAS